jgi:hypothetical protein
MSFVAVAGAGLAISVGGSLYQGSQAKLSGKIQGIFAESQARMEEATALETANLIRRAGNKARGTAKAAYAGAGVKLGEGSAAAVEDQMTLDIEHDAYQAILDGKNRARGARQYGDQAVQAGRDAFTASTITALGTAVSGLSEIGRSGWSTKARE